MFIRTTVNALTGCFRCVCFLAALTFVSASLSDKAFASDCAGFSQCMVALHEAIQECTDNCPLFIAPMDYYVCSASCTEALYYPGLAECRAAFDPQAACPYLPVIGGRRVRFDDGGLPLPGLY